MKNRRAISVALSVFLVLAIQEALLAYASAGFNKGTTGRTDKTSLIVAIVALVVAIFCIVGLFIVRKRPKVS